MKIFIVGSGKLADAILTFNLLIPSCEVVRWGTEHQTLNNKAIVVHAGSGRQLNECLAFCARTKSVFIELSTGLGTEKAIPNFPLISCPNTSVLLVKMLWMLKMFGKNFEHYEISITESHQSTKTTEPGTAYNFADSLKVPYTKVISVRDPEIQQNEIGIPQAFLSRHAYHKIIIRNNGEEVTIETKVLGHDSYTNGLRTIIEACINYKLEDKNYTVLDLIDNGML